MSIANDARSLYLDLIKSCLTDSVYADDPLANFVPYRRKAATPAWKRALIGALQAVLERYGLRLVERYSVPWNQHYAKLSDTELKKLREEDRHWPVRAFTFLGRKRLDNLQYCVESVLRDNIAGDLIETGVWRGGACILMRAILKAYGDDTRVVCLTKCRLAKATKPTASGLFFTLTPRRDASTAPVGGMNQTVAPLIGAPAETGTPNSAFAEMTGTS